MTHISLRGKCLLLLRDNKSIFRKERALNKSIVRQANAGLMRSPSWITVISGARSPHAAAIDSVVTQLHPVSGSVCESWGVVCHCVSKCRKFNLLLTSYIKSQKFSCVWFSDCGVKLAFSFLIFTYLWKSAFVSAKPNTEKLDGSLPTKIKNCKWKKLASF